MIPRRQRPLLPVPVPTRYVRMALAVLLLLLWPWRHIFFGLDVHEFGYPVVGPVAVVRASWLAAKEDAEEYESDASEGRHGG